MKITTTLDVFTLDELSPEAQDRAYETLANEAWENIDSDMVGERLAAYFASLADDNYDDGVMSKRDLKDKYRISIYWQVAYSQSDSAQIDGVLSRDYHPNLAWPDGIHTIRVTTGTHSWSYPTDVYGIDDDGGEGDHVCDQKLLDAAKDFVVDLCEKLYRIARDECEALCDKEYVVATYNDWGLTRRFNVDGTYAPSKFWAEK